MDHGPRRSKLAKAPACRTGRDCGTPSPTLPPGGLRLGRTSGSERGGRGWGELRTPNLKGMTLIEVILVMVIIGILSAVVVTKLDMGMTTSRASVDGAAYMIASDIRYAQEFAMANRVSKTVTFTNGSSVYTFSPASTGMDPSGRLPSGATIGTTVAFTFNSLGEPTSGGGSSVTVSGGGQTKTISVVNYTGKVNIP